MALYFRRDRDDYRDHLNRSSGSGHPTYPAYHPQNNISIPQDDGEDAAIDVQANVQQNAIGILNATRRTLPLLAMLYLIWNVIEIVTLSTVLGITWDQPCDEPTIRIILIARLVRDAAMAFVHARRCAGVEETELDYKIQSFSRLSIMLFFIFSQQWYTDGKQCRAHAPILYWSGIGVIVLLYLTILFPLLLVLLICACLPCVLTALRYLNVGDIPHSATQNEIDELETFQFDERYEDPFTHERAAQNVPHPTEVPSAPPKSPSHIGEDLGEVEEYKQPTATTTTTGTTPAGAPKPPDGNSTLAECAICLCDYEKGDLLRKLKCGHVFHKTCIDDWLKVSGTCPVDRKNIRGEAQSVAPRNTFANLL